MKFVTMKPTAENFEQWNEELAEKHDLDRFYSHPNRLFRFIENKRIDRLIKLAEIRGTDRVLEVGCGAGHILERIKNGKPYGIDISEIQIKRAKERLGSRAELLKSPGEKIPYKDNFFEKVLCSEVIEHVLEPRKLLLEMKRVLKDDGTLSLSIPNENLINFAKRILKTTGLIRLFEPKQSGWELAAKNNLDEWHLHEFNMKLIRQCSDGIFRITKVLSIPFFFLPFRYVLRMEK